MEGYCHGLPNFFPSIDGILSLEPLCITDQLVWFSHEPDIVRDSLAL